MITFHRESWRHFYVMPKYTLFRERNSIFIKQEEHFGRIDDDGWVGILLLTGLHLFCIMTSCRHPTEPRYQPVYIAVCSLLISMTAETRLKIWNVCYYILHVDHSMHVILLYCTIQTFMQQWRVVSVRVHCVCNPAEMIEVFVKVRAKSLIAN